MACDAISYTTINQLKILGLMVNLLYVRPTWPEIEINKDQLYNSLLTHWLIQRLQPYDELNINGLDLFHLESLSCIRILQITSRKLDDLFTIKNEMELKFNWNQFCDDQPLGIHITELWKESNLQKIELTTVGQLLGIYTSDLLSGSKTIFKGWE